MKKLSKNSGRKLNIFFSKRTFNFNFPGKTSRGDLKQKDSWYVFVNRGATTGIGECSILPGLSLDDIELFPKLFAQIERLESIPEVDRMIQNLIKSSPALAMALEMALLDLNNGGRRIYFESPFLDGQAIKINGLIWMGDIQWMKQQLLAKLEEGFDCIKIKVGALNHSLEMAFLEHVRDVAPDIELRLDANGAWGAHNAMPRLVDFSKFEIHSIEQPIRPNNIELMRELCNKSPIDIALDEELIGYRNYESKYELLQSLNPQFIILKPSLLGGFSETKSWIDCAKRLEIGYWLTSALESNIGLNAIAQFASSINARMPQGLGTGEVFSNNLGQDIFRQGDQLKHLGR